MRPSTRVVVVASALILTVLAGGPASMQTQVPRLLIESVLAPDCVEPGQTLTVIVRVSDRVGIAGIWLHFAGDRAYVLGSGRTYETLRHTFSVPTGQIGAVNTVGASVIETWAVGGDGVQGEVLRTRVSIGGCPDMRFASMSATQLAASVAGWKLRALTPAAFPGSQRALSDRVPVNDWHDLYAPDQSLRFFRVLERLDNLMGWWQAYAAGRMPFDWRTHCPAAHGISADGEVLHCWLTLHPEVANALEWAKIAPAGHVVVLPYSSWPRSHLLALDDAFYASYQWLNSRLTGPPPPGPVDPPQNQLPPTAAPIRTILDEERAWALYLSTVAHSLALEIGGFVPWTVTGYSADDLEMIFSIQKLLPAGLHAYSEGGVWKSMPGYVCDYVTPQPADRTFQFLVDQNIVRPSHYLSVAQLLDWAGRHIYHFSDYDGDTLDKTSMQVAYMHWQYYGAAPTSRVIAGTVRVNSDGQPHSWSWGCIGNTSFFHGVLRALNIPTFSAGGDDYPALGGNTVPIWPTIGAALSHGDDPNGFAENIQDRTFRPPDIVPASMLFVTLETFQNWFVTNPKDTNVGRQPSEVEIDVLPNPVMHLYCNDVANGTLTNGQVYDRYALYYSPGVLERRRHLWQRLALKDQLHDWCATWGDH